MISLIQLTTIKEEGGEEVLYIHPVLIEVVMPTHGPKIRPGAFSEIYAADHWFYIKETPQEIIDKL